MVLLVLAWLYLGFVCLAFGLGLCRLLTKTGFLANDKNPDLSILIAIGFISLTSILQIASLFVNISLGALVFVGVSSLALLVYESKALQNILPGWFSYLKGIWFLPVPVFLVVAAGTLLASVHGPTNYDTGLYHAQSIQWISKFGLVIGQGLVITRSCFNSSFFIISALTDFRFINGQAIFPVNGFLCLLFFATASRFVFSKNLKERFTGILTVISAYLFNEYFTYHYAVGSPVPDIAVALLTWMLFFNFLSIVG